MKRKIFLVVLLLLPILYYLGAPHYVLRKAAEIFIRGKLSDSAESIRSKASIWNAVRKSSKGDDTLFSGKNFPLHSRGNDLPSLRDRSDNALLRLLPDQIEKRQQWSNRTDGKRRTRLFGNRQQGTCDECGYPNSDTSTGETKQSFDGRRILQDALSRGVGVVPDEAPAFIDGEKDPL